jgi:hypothetical protein
MTLRNGVLYFKYLPCLSKCCLERLAAAFGYNTRAIVLIAAML